MNTGFMHDGMHTLKYIFFNMIPHILSACEFYGGAYGTTLEEQITVNLKQISSI